MKQILLSIAIAFVAAGVTLYAARLMEQHEGAVPLAGAADGGARAGSGGRADGSAQADDGARTDDGARADVQAASTGSPPAALRYTAELVEDAWVNGARTAGIDHKPLSHAGNSICYLTKVQVSGVQAPSDSNACRIEIDDFTGYWEVVAEVEEGGQSEVRCNARCLVWDQ